MAQSKVESSSTICQSIQIYQIEPIGRILLFRLPLPLIFFLFIILYFGVLLILHSIVDTPRPATLGDIFRHPSTYFYYPNLIAITYDLVGNPLLLYLLVRFQSYIPSQLIKLERDGLLEMKARTSRLDNVAYQLCTNRKLQMLMIVIIPCLIGISGFIANITVFSPQILPGKYAIFLAALGTYGRAVVFIQIIYIFLILANYRFSFRLRLGHPDGCSGLAPFGKLALAGYIYLFIFAMIQAIGTTAGGGAFERTLGGNVRVGALTFLWVLFPLAFALIFDHLIYKPHLSLQELQRELLFDISNAQTDYHRQVTDKAMKTAEQFGIALDNQAFSILNKDLEVIEVMSKLRKPVEDMHTWPIPKRTFRVVGIVANPLIPVLTPVIVEVIVRLLR